jgi:hypothetical protein
MLAVHTIGEEDILLDNLVVEVTEQIRTGEEIAIHMGNRSSSKDKEDLVYPMDPEGFQADHG